MLILLKRKNWRPDAILWANTGSEKQSTYDYLPIINAWLAEVGFPLVTVVQYEPDKAPYLTLEGNMILNATLPGATFNRGSCTAKFKIVPQNKWASQWPLAINAWERGERVLKLIGFEAGEEYRTKRADAKAHSGKDGAADAKKYEYLMPLMDWGYDLNKCIEVIESEGLPVPPKSACFFCPNQKEHEVHELSDDDRARIILMELSAEPYNQKIHGLWRRPRKADGRPGSITEYILQQGLPFTDLQDIAEVISLNEACGKAARNGDYTFVPPHLKVSLREKLIAAGHQPPPVIRGDIPGTRPYDEDRRIPLSMAEEDTIHGDIFSYL